MVVRPPGALVLVVASCSLLACSKFGTSPDDPADAAAPLPDGGTTGEASTSVQRRLYVFGGEGRAALQPLVNLQTAYSAVVHDDGTLDGWTAAPTLDIDRAHGASTFVDGVAFFLGGSDGASGATSSAQKAVFPLPPTGAWTPIQGFPGGRNLASAAGAQGVIYLSGGSSEKPELPTDTIERYDVATDTWGTGGSLKEALAGHATFIRAGQLYAVGGARGASTGVSTASSAAPITANGTIGTWRDVGTLPIQVKHHGLAVIGSWVFTVGGDGPAGATTNVVVRGAIAATGDITWQSVSTVPIPAGGITQACVVADRSTFYVLGGRADDTGASLQPVYIADVDATTGNITWHDGPALPEGRFGAGCAISPSSAP